MQDLKVARRKLKEKNFNLVIVKNGKVVFETESQGISGLLQAIEKLGNDLIGASVADRIVGRAAAMLCAYSKASSVFAVIISEEGAEVLEKTKVLYQFEKRVPNILNNEGTDICPFEKLVMDLTNPREAYEKLKSFIGSQS